MNLSYTFLNDISEGKKVPETFQIQTFYKVVFGMK